MGLLNAMQRQGYGPNALPMQGQPQQTPGGPDLSAATFASQPHFTQRMAMTGQLQEGAPQLPHARVAPLDAQLAMMLAHDPFHGQRVAQFVQQAFPQKRKATHLGGGTR